MTPQDQREQNLDPIQSVNGKEPVRDQDKIQLFLSYLGLLALIPLLTVKDSPFVTFHARQGVVLFCLIAALSVVNVIPYLGQLVYCVGFVVWAVLTVMGITKALSGERWRMPVISGIVDKVF